MRGQFQANAVFKNVSSLESTQPMLFGGWV